MQRFFKLESSAAARHWLFLGAWLLSVALFWRPLNALATLSLNDYRYSHIVLMPLIGAGLIYWKKATIFRTDRSGSGAGFPILACGLALYGVGRWSGIGENAGIFTMALAIVTVWIAAFVICHGLSSAKAALFPLLFLLLFAPIPGAWLDRIIVMLQRGSAHMTQLLFWAVNFPAFREGNTFSLPGITIEIAKECSSIRSGTALFITGLLSGYAFIRSPWRRVVLSALTVPIAMFTNAVRIVILSWLSVRVDRGYLYGNLHHEGGALFSLISVAILIVAILILSEDKLRLARSAP